MTVCFSRSTGAVLLASILFTAACRSADSNEMKMNIQALKGEVESNLRQHVLQPWFPRALDRTHGGFFENYAEDWSPVPDTARSLVYQSRLTWMSAQVAIHYPAQAKEYGEYSRQGLEFLQSKMWDAGNGGFFWSVDLDGRPLRNGEKHAYGIAFGIYACSTHYKATRDPRALDLARKAYAWLEDHAHDSEHGGYYEALRANGERILSAPPGTESVDMIGTRYGFKSMNSHIHLLEALTALHEVWPDDNLKNRLKEVFEIVRDKVAVNPGCMNLYFNPDWRPIPENDSFGHDVETTYLLVEASAELGQPDDERTWSVARTLLDHALDYGWDSEHGGLYNEGGAFGKHLEKEKIWWVEAEALNALLLCHERFGRQTPRYRDAFLKQWEFIQKHQVDSVRNGWISNVNADGTAPAGQLKSSPWKEPYHQGRALINVANRLAHMASVNSDK